MIENLVFVSGGILAFLLMVAAMISWLEKERRAAKSFSRMLIVVLAAYTLPVIFPEPFMIYSIAGLTAVWVLAIIVAAVPFNNFRITRWEKPLVRIDERTIMFSRNLLKPESKRYNEYYKTHPEHQEPDNVFRENPGLLSEKSKYFSPGTFHAAVSAFDVIEYLRDMAERKPAANKIAVDSDAMPPFLEKWSKKMGAHSFGITKLHEYHKYSVVGRGEAYGQKVVLNHQNAIAVTTEMDHEMVSYAPQGPIVMESARQYVNSGVIALKLAGYIRSLGYEARAHIDGNYRVVCPLVAKDAGLGEIGRMGLLMTPKLGPRVRIAVVTTNMPLRLSKKTSAPSVIDFCLKCKKCADVCPSNAIQHEEPGVVDGIKRWKINQEACFTVWTKFGTDCGRCMAVCPYSHPNNIMHNLIRKGLEHSNIFRSAALKMDDVVYGRKPKPKKLKAWLASDSIIPDKESFLE
ncbi:MAG TPA: 4Fe-4S dicluster domain-containing protein [Bacteroidales bacterium]|nr:4Fe-4S dicluster domain-containing protein [Bacteroidales bacterium]